jgi:ribosome-binding protein aMBF1 (putative translation factor)
MNLSLKFALLQSGVRQIELANTLGISESLCSKIVNGWLEPDDDLKKDISEILKRPVKELFPNQRRENVAEAQSS